MSDAELERFVADLQSVGAACFTSIPNYQCLSGRRTDLADIVITVARREDGTIGGFSSSLLLDVPGLRKPVLHLGLTCVNPQDRGQRLTHRLTVSLVMKYLARHRPRGKVWVSSVACVLSSIGSVALNFDDVYPSPYSSIDKPTKTHLKIADTVSARYRDRIFIRNDATLDRNAFVFRGSVRGTVFQKEGDDSRYLHRDDQINDWYSAMLNFDDGDEVIQIGHYSLRSFTRYLLSLIHISEPTRPY